MGVVESMQDEGNIDEDGDMEGWEADAVLYYQEDWKGLVVFGKIEI